jgi:hypothetical protein
MSSFDQQLIATFAPALRQRNTFFDALFYDVGALDATERAGLSPELDREGSVVLVPPAGAGRPILHYPTVGEFLAAQGDRIRALAIAGVGSSVLGTAALARNVANAYDIDVAGLVSGYGATDMLVEAMGGWCFYGATDAFRHEIRTAINRLARFGQTADTAPRDFAAPRSTGRDLPALEEILDAAPPRLRLLVGHSKGDLVLDYVLERFARRHSDGHPYFDRLAVATFGAVADLPPAFRRVHQFLGALDWFGGLNSRADVPCVRIPDAWHHLNTAMPFHLPAEQVLRQYVVVDTAHRQTRRKTPPPS